MHLALIRVRDYSACGATLSFKKMSRVLKKVLKSLEYDRISKTLKSDGPQRLL